MSHPSPIAPELLDASRFQTSFSFVCHRMFRAAALGNVAALEDSLLEEAAQDAAPMAMSIAAGAGHVEATLALIRALRGTLLGGPALIMAATKDRGRCVEILIDAADEASIQAALNKAASHGHSLCVAALVDKASHLSREAALCEAARHGHMDCARLLLPGCDPSAADSEGRACFDIALDHGHGDVAAMIIAFFERAELDLHAPRAQASPASKTLAL